MASICAYLICIDELMVHAELMRHWCEEDGPRKCQVWRLFIERGKHSEYSAIRNENSENRSCFDGMFPTPNVRLVLSLFKCQ